MAFRGRESLWHPARGVEGEGGGVRVLTTDLIAAIIFACVFGGALGGMLIRAALPEHHLAQATQDVIKLGTGMIATLSALVIGLLLASAKSSFDSGTPSSGSSPRI